MRGKDTRSMDTGDTTTPGTLLSVPEAAAALGLRPATIKDYILTERLAGVRVPYGHTVRLFVPPAEVERYRHDALGGKGWDKRRDKHVTVKGEGTIKGDPNEDETAKTSR
jgi:hypothetical protein